MGYEFYISVFALALSIFSIWYSRFRKGELKFSCSNWTALGLGVNIDGRKYIGASFIIKISAKNDGAIARILKDLMVIAKTSDGSEVFYHPVVIFDLNTYFEHMGGEKVMPKSLRGIVPLPSIIPERSSFEFEDTILFNPFDDTDVINIYRDLPCTLEVYALVDDDKNYRQIGKQLVLKEDVDNLKVGNFSSFESSVSKANREAFINGARKTANQRLNSDTGTVGWIGHLWS